LPIGYLIRFPFLTIPKTFFRHYESKEALLYTVAEEMLTEFQALLLPPSILPQRRTPSMPFTLRINMPILLFYSVALPLRNYYNP